MNRSLSFRLALVWIGARFLDPFAAAQPIDTGWVWTTPGYDVGAGGIAVSDFDADGRDELHLSSRAGSYYGSQNGYWHAWLPDGAVIRQEWSSLLLEDGIQKLISTRSPENRFIAVSGSKLLVFHGTDHSLERTIVPDDSPIADLVVEDLDGDGDLELALCDEESFYVLSFSTGLETGRRNGFGCSQLLSGQLDADPAKELVLVGNLAGGFVLDGATLAIQWVELDGFGERATLADADSDGDEEIIYYREDDEDLVAIAPGLPMTYWEIEGCYPNYLDALDIDDDGDQEVVAHSGVLGGLAAIDATTGIPVWSLPLGSEPRSVAVGDFYGDDERALAVAGTQGSYGDGILLFDPTTLLLRARTPPIASQLATFALGDLDGDSSPDLVTAFWGDSYGYGEERIAYFDISARRLEWIEPTPEETEFLALGQADADPQPEVCRTNSGYYYDQALRCEDALTHAVEWGIDFQGDDSPGQVALLDLDGSAPLEVVVPAASGVVYVFEGASGWLRWASPASVSVTSNLLVANLDGVGPPELLAGGGFDYYGGNLAVIDPATGALLAGPHEIYLSAFDAANVDGDPEVDVIGGIGTYGTSQLAEIDPWTGAIQPAIALFDEPVRAIRIAEMTGDAQLDYVVVSGPKAFVIDGETTNVVWESPDLGSEAQGSRDLELADLGGSSRPEIIVNVGVGFAVFGIVDLVLFADGFETANTAAWSATLP
jgi:outer membrane protein assembly factor BamB